MAQQPMSFRNLVITTLIGALTFVTGLFWRDAVATSIEILVPPQDEVLAKWIAALFVTVVVFAVSFILFKTRDVGKRKRR